MRTLNRVAMRKLGAVIAADLLARKDEIEAPSAIRHNRNIASSRSPYPVAIHIRDLSVLRGVAIVRAIAVQAISRTLHIATVPA